MWSVLLIAFVAGAMAQVPQPCSGPSTFTGRFRRFDEERKEFVEGKIYYDADNQRIREFEFEDIAGEHEVYDKLKLYALNVEYTLDLKTRKCNVTTPRPSTWVPFGVPPDANFQWEGVLGVVGVPYEEVTVSVFTGKFDGQYPYVLTVTQPDCFPVDLSVYGSTGPVYAHMMVCQHIGKPFALHYIGRDLYRRIIPEECIKAYA